MAMCVHNCEDGGVGGGEKKNLGIYIETFWGVSISVERAQLSCPRRGKQSLPLGWVLGIQAPIASTWDAANIHFWQ